MQQMIFAFAGGALIGASAAILLLFDGRIAGISGILGTILDGAHDAWRWAFLIGLIAASLLAPLAHLPTSPSVLGDGWVYLAGGLLVGIGTRVGSGCTSGHGVCGLSNLSLRSLTATVLFMLSAGLTVFVVRHVIA
jgi:uncharacterized membrane protein YedE/YeeE